MFGRRRRGEENEASAPVDAEPAEGTAESGEPAKSDRSGGPFDESEVDLDEARTGRIDLGGLLVGGAPGMKLQLQMDTRTGNATSALLTVGEAAVQLVAVAAPRSSGLWEQTRLQIAADAKRRGGRVEEASGPFGTEMRLVVPVQSAEGKQLLQPSRISAVDGPRWMLRATFLGKATTDATVFAQLVELVRRTVVIRGGGPMAPGDVIQLKAPPGASVQPLGGGAQPPATPSAEPQAEPPASPPADGPSQPLQA